MRYRRLIWSTILASLVLTVRTSAESPKVVAVLPFATQYSRLPESGRVILEESLRSRVGDVLTPRGYLVLTQENMLSIIRDNGIDTEKVCEASCAVAAGKELKAKYIFSGAIASSDGDHTVFIRMFDVETGALVSSIKLRGKSAAELQDQFDRSWRPLFEKAGFKLTVEAGQSDAVSIKPDDHTAPVALPPPISQEAIQLDVDADILVAHDAALSADKGGEKDPAAASKAWAELGAMKEPNPYKAQAKARAKAWKEFAERVAAREKQKRNDGDKLRKVLPLASVPAEQKADLVARYVVTYGLDAAVEVRPLVSAEQWVAACGRLPPEKAAALEQPIEVKLTDVSGRPRKGRLSIDGDARGEAPGKVSASLCARKLAVEDPATHDVWEAPLTTACPPDQPCLVNAVFTDRIVAGELPSDPRVPQAVIDLINTHEAFRNVPRAKSVRAVYMANDGKITQVFKPTNGLVSKEIWSRWDTHGNEQSALTFLGGLMSLSYDLTTHYSRTPSVATHWITSLTDIRGQLFPLASGNRLSFTTEETTLQRSNDSVSTVRVVNTFEVGAPVEGSSISRDLPGLVFPVLWTGNRNDKYGESSVTWYWSAEYGVAIAPRGVTVTSVTPLQ